MPCKTGPAQNGRKIGEIRKHVVGKTAERGLYNGDEDWVPTKSAQIIPLKWTQFRPKSPFCLAG